MSEAEIIGQRLKKVIECFNAIKNFGLDEDILIAYICQKTKLSKHDVNLMIRATDDFYTKLIKKDIIKGLREKEK